MKRIALLAVLTVIAGCGSSSPSSPSTGPIVFTAALSAANEVPPVTNADANGRGTATMTLTAPRDSSGAITGPGTMNFAVQLSGFPAGTVVRAAHIHPGAAGINGSPLIDTGLTAAAIRVTLRTAPARWLSAAFRSPRPTRRRSSTNPAGFYFNAHTAVNPGGAVRGQLVKQ